MNKKFRKEIISHLSNIEYQLFVVNTHAVALQGKDGKYYTKYIPLTPLILQNMLLHKSSLGCYQQVYCSNYIRWICMDFDCCKGKTVDLKGLFQRCVLPVTDYLDRINVHYLLEFSGRRGIHVWIIMDKLIKKSIGFRIISRILDEIPELQEALESQEYGLDKFPATGIGNRSKVGKQVKFPLSYHKKGFRSFFFEKRDCIYVNGESEKSQKEPLSILEAFLDIPSYIEEKEYIESVHFYQSQVEILESYEPETEEELCAKLGIEDNNTAKLNIYKQYSLISNCEASLDQIVQILSKTTVYYNIFKRMERGQAETYDWLVLLGTFSCFDSCVEMLKTLFSTYPNYDVSKTIKNIRKLKGRYYPATFGYLYRIYGLEMESGIDPNMTGVDYLAERLSFDTKSKGILKKQNENICLLNPQNIVVKELGYMCENDEVISVAAYNKLSNIRDIEAEKIEEYVNHIVCSDTEDSKHAENENLDEIELFAPLSYKVYSRLEEGGRIRSLVSLDTFDRLVTTSLALRLCRDMKYTWESYSYRLSYLETQNLFYPWFSSWSRYIDQIKAYLDLPFMGDNYVIYLDLKHCYESIDILVIYNSFKTSLTQESRRAFEYLCAYNDGLMKALNEGIRIGVPQGPAYARILTEIYLDKVIKDIIQENKMDDYFQIFRYVDDIVVFSENKEDAEKLFNILRDGFGKRGLPINTVKSHNYGLVAELSVQEKNELLHRNRFNYDLVEKPASEMMFASERKNKALNYLYNNSFQMSMLGYIFSDYTFEEAKQYCFEKYGRKIMSSREGRGKSFRQFYRWLFLSSDNIQHAAVQDWFFDIPVASINFSNFITTLYFMIKDNQISSQDARLIVLSYLNDEFDLNALLSDDRATVEAIQMKFTVG